MLFLILLLVGFIYLFILFFAMKNEKLFFLSKEHTEMIRALMAVMIVFSHVAAQTEVKHFIPLGAIATKIIGGGGALGVALFFFLSGYGNYISIIKVPKRKKAYYMWLIKRIIKLIVIFFIAYGYDNIIMFFIGQKITGLSFLKQLFTLSMPGTTTWYIKIQLLYYFIIALAMWLFEDRNASFVAFILGSSLMISVPFYIFHSSWWNGYTGLCFASGVVLALYKDNIFITKWMSNWVFIVSLLIGFIICYLISLIGVGGYIIQNVVYIAMCVALLYLTSHLRVDKNIIMIGRASLSIYLIHIGMIRTIFYEGIYNEYRMVLFLLLVVIGSTVTMLLSENVNSKLTSVLTC